MSKFDPPSDPYGSVRCCRHCDAALKYDWLSKEWYCPNEDCEYSPNFKEQEETTDEEEEDERTG